MADDSGWQTTPNSRNWKSDISKATKKRRENGDYPVGYARPPKDTRWKPGQSGNPRGRPKKIERAATERQMLRDFFNAIEQQVTITIEGKRKKMPLIAAIYNQGTVQAAKGNYKFFAKILDLYGQAIKTAATLNPNAARSLEAVERHLLETDESDHMQSEFIEGLNRLKRRTRKF